MKFIDLRSDTVTEPTQKMREAMFNAEVGDDIYGDDPTVNEFERYAAELVGKEDAIFIPSGTFGNQLAIFTHCKRGNEVILGDDCHIVTDEVGAASVIAGVQLRTLISNNGALNPEEVEKRIRREEDDVHYPGTGLICLENAHSNGMVISLENMKSIFDIAEKHDIPVHLDGARLFNAASYLGVNPKEITKYCDSVMFCVSKGLCAPIGSILAGNKEFISKAIKKRKLMGGSLRQSGILAAAGIVALKDMRERLSDDHDTALLLGQELSKIPGIEVNLNDIHINMVFFNMSKTGYNTDKLVDELYSRGIKINPAENGSLRFVTHYWISKENVYTVVNTMKEIIGKNN